jgi:hypothetical protein
MTIARYYASGSKKSSEFDWYSLLSLCDGRLFLASAFATEICAYAVMNNYVHVVIHGGVGMAYVDLKR